MKDYSEWFNEIATTKIDKSHGGIKIYKLILLLCMLDKGKDLWYTPVKPEEIALPFYRYLIDNENILKLSFSNAENEKYQNTFDLKYISRLIRSNPMQYWGGTSTYKFAQFDGTRFWINLDIDMKDKEYVYEKTRKACAERIQNETGERFDFNIQLEDEYQYQLNQAQISKIAETERETYIMTRIGQGKFKNRLLEKYRECPICKIENRDLLIASHIKPWRSCEHEERLDPNNGFIFCPNHDKLFDLGFISFQNDGRIILSGRNIPSDNDKMGISESICIPTSIENQRYLVWHREQVFVR